MAENGVYELKCEVQTYAWGKPGTGSEVARLSKLAHPDFNVEENQTYAELWMGAHPKAPSTILSSGIALSDFIKSNKDVLGSNVANLFNGELPFLFKVLSVNKSLSIQAHPNKKHAKKLNQERPEIYKDPNHKPEMAIALTPFEGLCGFRPLTEIQSFLKTVPELQAVVGNVATEQLCSCAGKDEAIISSCLKSCFENVMKCDPDVRSAQIQLLVNRVSAMDGTSAEFQNTLGELLLRINSQFPADVGCLVIYFLNLIKLSPGEAMYLGANVPHAYLDGNCIECMACSDNVVRAGCTPKYIDVPTLCEMLDYSPGGIKKQKYPALQSDTDPYVKIYNPAVDDFAVQCISVPDEIKDYTFESVDSASILLVLNGKSTSCTGNAHLRPGAVFFIAANAKLSVQLEGGLFCFRALCMLN